MSALSLRKLPGRGHAGDAHEPASDASLAAAHTFDELVRESLYALLPATVFVTWVWCVYVLFFAKAYTLFAYAALAATILTSALSYSLRQQQRSLAIGVYLFGLLAVVTLIALALRSTASLHLYIVVVLVAATLLDGRGLGLVIAICIVFTAFITRSIWVEAGAFVEVMQVTDAISPVALIVLTGFTAWLSTRRLTTALDWALTMTNESQKHAAEAQRHRGELQQVLKNLDEAYVRLEHANSALLVAQAAAEKAYRFKSEFVANVSHELRTPLNLIIGFSEMMATAPESYSGVPLPKEYRGDVSAIYRSAGHLSDLIDDVLDLAQIESGHMAIYKEPTQLGDVVREATEMVRSLIEAHHLKLEVLIPDHLPVLHLDRTRIRQVLLNLLTNATRFTEQGFIRARVRLEPGEGHDATQWEVVVTIEDSGRGIPPDRLSKAFEAFTRLHKDQIRDGTGLGLAVSKRFIALHGGRMWIESEVGRGTTVGFALRVTSTAIATERLADPVNHGFDAPVALVLHDDARALAMLRRSIAGFQFNMVTDPNEVQDAIYTLQPAAMIADCDWVEHHQAVWNTLHVPEAVPVFRVPLPGTRRIGLQLGAVDYLTKPITREGLTASLSRLKQPFEKVLIVDDDPHIVRLMARMVRAMKPAVQVLRAFSGHEGLQLARQHHPDVILLDLLMPDVSGYEVLKEMAHDGTFAHTSVIIVSARGVEDEGAPFHRPIQIERHAGFTTIETLNMIGAMLSGMVPVRDSLS